MTERAAEPEPLIRASVDNSEVESERPRARVAASVRAANPEAEDAIPEPVGNEFRVATRNEPPRLAHRRTRSRWASARARKATGGIESEPSSATRSIRSGSYEPSSNATVDRLTHSESVIEIEAFIGIACSRSCAPQYLTKAMLAGAVCVALPVIRRPPREGLGRRARRRAGPTTAGPRSQSGRRGRDPTRRRAVRPRPRSSR